MELTCLLILTSNRCKSCDGNATHRREECRATTRWRERHRSADRGSIRVDCTLAFLYNRVRDKRNVVTVLVTVYDEIVR